MLTWFDDRASFMQAIEATEPCRRSGEDHIAGHATWRGYCCVCDRMVDFAARVGGFYADRPNLREGLVCPHCRLSNRNRLIHHGMSLRLAQLEQPTVALLERLTPLFVVMHKRLPQLLGSEYMGEEQVSGQHYQYHGHDVRHESITGLSYADASLDLIGHCDVLEHVYDYRGALRELRRVLRPGGQMICTVPFFMTRDAEAVLARPAADGSIEFFGPPEYHGDGLRPQGILTWHHFGWKLLDDARDAGFAAAQIGLNFDLFSGFATNNHPNAAYGLMYPLLFRCTV